MLQIRFHSLITSALILGLLSGKASAVVFTWTGGGGTNNTWGYQDPSPPRKYLNWNTTKLPVAGDTFEFGGTGGITINDLTISTTSITFLAGAGAFVLQGNPITFTGGGITNLSSNLQTIDMALGLNVTIAVTGAVGADIAIGGAISGAGGINKTGANTLFLNGINTYTGATNITVGALGGTGTIAAASGANDITVSNGAFIAPGAAGTTGTLNLNFGSTTGKLRMSNGSGFQYHLGTAGSSIGSVGVSDMLGILNAAAGDVVFDNNNINFLGTGALGFYKIFDTSLDSTTWTGLTVETSGQISAGLTGSNLANGYSAFFIMGGSSYGGTSGDIYVQVIPEPSAPLLGGLGTVLLLLRRRRR